MFQKTEAFYIKKADYGFRRDLWLLFEAGLTRTCSLLTTSCRHLWVVFFFFCCHRTARMVWIALNAVTAATQMVVIPPRVTVAVCQDGQVQKRLL